MLYSISLTVIVYQDIYKIKTNEERFKTSKNSHQTFENIMVLVFCNVTSYIFSIKERPSEH